MNGNLVYVTNGNWNLVRENMQDMGKVSRLIGSMSRESINYTEGSFLWFQPGNKILVWTYDTGSDRWVWDTWASFRTDGAEG